MPNSGAAEGKKAPAFSAVATDGKKIALQDFAGKPLVLYFYPKDMTSGCTVEACDWRDNMAAIRRGGAAVVGVSPDSVKSHGKFTEKESLNYPLLADEDHAICKTYGVWVEKSMYGRKYMGVERSSFLIDRGGKVARAWRGVKVKGHVKEVMEALRALK